MKGEKQRAFLIVSVFIIIIAFPFINTKLRIINDIESFENKRLAFKPQMDINNLDGFPEKYQNFYNDHFTARSRLLRYFNSMFIGAFNKSPMPDCVLIGDNGWLFGGGNELDAYTGRNFLRQGELISIRKELESRRQFVEEQGAKFYFLIVPAKANIYSDFVPGNVINFNKQSWGEQLITYLNTNSNVETIDLFESLKTKKGKGLLYYKLDIHWTELGAFYAANEVLNKIHQDYPIVSPLSEGDFKITEDKMHPGNLANMFGNNEEFGERGIKLERKGGYRSIEVQNKGYPIPNGFPYPWEYEKRRRVEGSLNPIIMLISDSFGTYLLPFLSEEFSISEKIFDSWQYLPNEEIIKKEKPSIVLLIVWEPNLRCLTHPVKY